jgi:hypothetical protein
VVRAGQLAELRPDGRITIDHLPPSDDWDEWVQSRARRYDRPAASTRCFTDGSLVAITTTRRS